MKALDRTLPVLASILAATLPAQNFQVTNVYGATSGRSYAIVEDGSVRTLTGGGQAESRQAFSSVNQYVHAHNSGSYVVFSDSGSLHRLDKPAQLAEVKRLYDPLRALAAKQQALSKAQQPLAHQQQSLSKVQQPLAEQQRGLSDQQNGASTIDDHVQLAKAQGGLGQQQAELGQVQGAIGQQQGELGQLQGEIGRQQGELARAAYARMQTMFTQCLKEGSCPRVAS